MLLLEYASVYCFGALCYGSLEFLWRGWTHWTMLLTGGLCFLFLYIISGLLRVSLLKKCLLGAFFITTTEFLVGALVNIKLGWRVWDYSWLKPNLMGQICLLYFLVWLVLCIPCMYLGTFLRCQFFTTQNRPRKTT